MGVVVTQIRQLGSRLEMQKQRKLNQQEEDIEENEEDIPADFDIDSVCALLDQPREVRILLFLFSFSMQSKDLDI